LMEVDESCHRLIPHFTARAYPHRSYRDRARRPHHNALRWRTV
jgi:hypothetical protein